MKAVKVDVEGFFFPVVEDLREERARRIFKCLNKDFRMPLTTISRKTGIPITSVLNLINGMKANNRITLVCEKKSLESGKIMAEQ